MDGLIFNVRFFAVFVHLFDILVSIVSFSRTFLSLLTIQRRFCAILLIAQ